jgi:hypothetical protein
VCRICGLQNIKMTQKIHVKYFYLNLVNSRNLPKTISENDKNSQNNFIANYTMPRTL